MNVPACKYPGSCTYWVVATQVTQVHDSSGNSCFTTLPGAVKASFNPGCANVGFNELLEFCDGWNTGGNDCFGYYSNAVQIFPDGPGSSLDFDSFRNGFSDFSDIFLMVFMAFVLVRLLGMAGK